MGDITVAIHEKFDFNACLEFRKVNLKDVKEMLNNNTEKAVVSNSIPAKVLKGATICSPVF